MYYFFVDQIKIIIVTLLGVSLFPILVLARWDDLLEQVFEESQDYWFAEDADAEDLFDTKISIWIWNWDGDGEAEVWDLFWLNGSVIARAAQRLLRLTVILGIPMVMIAGIKIMLAQWDEAKLKEWLKLLWFVALGIFVALMSVVIVYLIISITWSNLWNI